MLRPIRRGLRSLLRSAGYELRRSESAELVPNRIVKMLHEHGVRTVLDVGANQGQYAADLFDHGYAGGIVSFEALPSAWNLLASRASGRPAWKVAGRCALSDRNGELQFHQSQNSVSSSLLPMADAHRQAAPESEAIAVLQVQSHTLDDYLASHPIELPAFLKLDVQGAEMLVLQGAGSALREKIIGVQLELSLRTLYQGQPLYWQLDAFLRSLRFECWELLPEFYDPRTWRRLQYDGIYFKETA